MFVYFCHIILHSGVHAIHSFIHSFIRVRLLVCMRHHNKLWYRLYVANRAVDLGRESLEQLPCVWRIDTEIVIVMSLYSVFY